MAKGSEIKKVMVNRIQDSRVSQLSQVEKDELEVTIGQLCEIFDSIGENKMVFLKSKIRQNPQYVISMIESVLNVNDELESSTSINSFKK